jgi:hypothetical protein
MEIESIRAQLSPKFDYELKEKTHVLIRRLFFGSTVRSTTFRFDDRNVISWEEVAEDLSSKPVTDAKDAEVLTRTLESLRAEAASKKTARAMARGIHHKPA